MSELFEEWSIGSMTMGDRILRSATAESLCTREGLPSKPLIDTYIGLAEGGVGAIITGFCSAQPEGKPAERALALWDGMDDEPFADLVRRVHEAGSPLVLQLVYGGSKSKLAADDPRWLAATDDPGAPTVDIIGPSSIPNPVTGLVPREATKEDLEAVVEAFATAARRAKTIGFDGVELHCAHGYLLSQFFSPAFNHRHDEYGGTLEGRARLAIECVKAMRESTGPDYPILVKLNAGDAYDDPSGKLGGLSEDEAATIAQMLVRAGASAIDVSGDWHGATKVNHDDQPYFGRFAAQLKRVLDVPIILTGGWREPRIIGSHLAQGTMDAAGLSRPLIREPYLADRWREGDLSRSLCVECGICGKQGGIPCPYR